MRLIRPRPPFSTLIHQPGLLFFGLMLGHMIIFMIVCQFASMETMETWPLIVFGLTLTLLWTAVSRHWRSRTEPGWIEGFGRALGFVWIITITAGFPVLLLLLSLR